MNFSEIINNPGFQSLLNSGDWNILADWLMDKNVDQLYVDEVRIGMRLFVRIERNGWGSGRGVCRGCGGGWQSEHGKGSGRGSERGNQGYNLVT